MKLKVSTLISIIAKSVLEPIVFAIDAAFVGSFAIISEQSRLITAKIDLLAELPPFSLSSHFMAQLRMKSKCE